MKHLLIIFFVIFVVSTFGGYFSPTIDYLTTLADKCLNDRVFYQDLFDMNTGETFAEAIFIPSIVLDDLNEIIVNRFKSQPLEPLEFLGVLVLKVKLDQVNNQISSIGIQEFKISGTNSYGSPVSDRSAVAFLTTENYFVKIEDFYGSIISSLDYVMLSVYGDFIWNKTIIIQLRTNTSQGLWRIKPDSPDFTKLKSLIVEIK